ncbi:hypothetical protein D3C75_829370 [compost metagenome]
MNGLTAGLLLGLIAGVPAGAAIHAQYVRSEAPAIQSTTVVADRNPCKPVSQTESFPKKFADAAMGVDHPCVQ